MNPYNTHEVALVTALANETGPQGAMSLRWRVAETSPVFNDLVFFATALKRCIAAGLLEYVVADGGRMHLALTLSGLELAVYGRT